jgi:hypothetical protein
MNPVVASSSKPTEIAMGLFVPVVDERNIIGSVIRSNMNARSVILVKVYVVIQ